MENFLYSIYNPADVNLLTRLRLQLSHLNEHTFRHGFNPMCSCNTEIKSNEHFLLPCPPFLFFCFRLSAKDQVNILLYCHSSSNPISLSQDIVKVVINFLIKNDRFKNDDDIYEYKMIHIYIYIYMYICFSFFCFVE